VKSAVAAVGGALTMLLIVAAWQARTAALSVTSPLQMQQPELVGYAPTSQTIVPGGQPNLLPVSYEPSPSNLVYLSAPRPVPVRYVTAQPSRRRLVTRERSPRRSWVKTALVIGGSTGAGAGIGGIAGGKKGALIGAAIGGGAASLFEALKR
jgi:hypothetical protein